MPFDKAMALADAVLFEGYLLYPYRASALKNRLRWQFGVLAPPSAAAEPSFARTECVVEATSQFAVLIRVRFLHLHTRTTDVWDQGFVHAVDFATRSNEEQRFPFEVPGSDSLDGKAHTLRGAVEVRWQSPQDDRATRVSVTVLNETPWRESSSRDDMLRHSFVSTHTLLGVRGGHFASLTDPPRWAQDAARTCHNEHTWPVLVGDPGERDVILSAPIILPDYPAVAAQSPGDLFDATEIDEILSLRTMTLTDQEKEEARRTDPRAAAIIDRIEGLSGEEFEQLHGTVQFPGKQ